MGDGQQIRKRLSRRMNVGKPKPVGSGSLRRRAWTKTTRSVCRSGATKEKK
ncbi:unnamed protein product [Trichogramma brassicae]|uniref:Uncharacterized protein n=1 Tax=Trichogramma brassicae TaxID=86971 RepID=A0A6H5I7G8_9HYME|nr:unnamed protein product [Trichogramma brassicae]